MLKILVTGGNGQLGSELKMLSTSDLYEFLFVDIDNFDMGKPQAVQDFFKDKIFAAIINCAAYTAVDKAETESTLADAINHHAVATLAQIAKDKNISLIHVSTDYVFDGKNCSPYIETDISCPVNVYGKTKLAGEKAILNIAPRNTMIIRTSWLYSSFGNNFVKTMLTRGLERDSLNVISDQIGTPTYARDLAQVVMDILPNLKNNSPQIYHYSNEGVASWYDFAKAIFELSKINCTVIPITTSQYPTPAKRPHYSLLNKVKIKSEFKISIPHWRDSLAECLKLMGKVV